MADHDTTVALLTSIVNACRQVLRPELVTWARLAMEALGYGHVGLATVRAVLATGLATYPDVTIVCGELERDRDDNHAVTNPTLLVEVTSRSSDEYDRGEKFENYKQIPSLKQYVIVSHTERRIDVWTGDADGWQQRAFAEGEVAELASSGARLDVRELYESAVPGQLG